MCLASAEAARSPLFKAQVVFPEAMIQGPTNLSDVGAGAFSTRDAVHHSLFAILLGLGPLGALLFHSLSFSPPFIFIAIFLTSCTHVPHVATSSSDCPIVFMQLCL